MKQTSDKNNHQLKNHKIYIHSTSGLFCCSNIFFNPFFSLLLKRDSSFSFSLENSDVSSFQEVAIKDGRRMNEKKHKPLQFVLL
jgi:hypothetical protein